MNWIRKKLNLSENQQKPPPALSTIKHSNAEKDEYIDSENNDSIDSKVNKDYEIYIPGMDI